MKPSKLLATVRDFTENTSQQEMIHSNDWTRNMSELTNTLWQTLWGFFCCFIFIVFHFLSAYKCLTDRRGGWHLSLLFKTDREWTSTFLNTDPEGTTFPKNKSISLTPVATPYPTLLLFCQEKHWLKWSSVDVFCFLQDILNWWLETGWRYSRHIFTCQKLAKHHQTALALMLWWPYITGENCPPAHISQDNAWVMHKYKRKEMETCGNTSGSRGEGMSFLLFTVSFDWNEEGTC